jgi:hypothetical protein
MGKSFKRPIKDFKVVSNGGMGIEIKRCPYFMGYVLYPNILTVELIFFIMKVVQLFLLNKLGSLIPKARGAESIAPKAEREA